MSNEAYFSSDFHLNHGSILKGFRGKVFSSAKEHNEVIINNIFETLKPGDRLFHLGDLAWKFTSEEYQAFFQLFQKHRIELHLLIGNHEKISQWKHKAIKSIGYMKEITIEKQPIVMCHYRMSVWARSHYNSFLLHGHCHKDDHTDQVSKFLPPNDTYLTGKKLNCNVEFWDFKPINWEQVKEYMSKCSDNFDLIRKSH